MDQGSSHYLKGGSSPPTSVHSPEQGGLKTEKLFAIYKCNKVSLKYCVRD